MAVSAVKSAAVWLGNLVVEEVKYLHDVRDKVEGLQGDLEWMQCFLSDADKRQNKDAVIRKWISQIKDLAYDAEDVLEKFILRVSYKDRHRGLWSEFRWLSSLVTDARALHEIGTDIDDLRRKVSELTSRLQTYGVKKICEDISASSADPSTPQIRRTYSHLKDDMIVGIDDDIASLADQLIADQDHKVVVISGMGGLGKTTLAREVYHHPEVRGHFSGFAWAHISQQFQTKSVIMGILLELIPVKDMDRRNRIQGLQDAQLPGELFQVLKEKSYLVVLDDMWKTEDWVRLQAAFPVTDRSTGSKILVTTRNSNIISGLGSSVLNHEPKLLDDDNSMKLLLRKACPTTEGDPGAVGKEENFIHVIDLNQTNQDEPSSMLNAKLRRLAIYVGEEADASLLDSSFKKAPNIRSLLFFPNQECKQKHYGWMRSVCNEFQLLRALDLNGFNIEGSLPKEIGNLIYLRFLSLNQTRVTKVPASISYLSCLETLDLRVLDVVVMLPNVLFKLRRLKYLYLPSRILSKEVDTEQGYVIEGGEMMRLDGLQYLETLENVDIDRVEIKGLLGLKNMRRLTASCVSKKENLDPFLKSLSIKRLSLKIDGSIVSEDPMILSSCQPLHSLDIDNKIRGSLHFQMFPENLVYIGLWYCYVQNDPMRVFEWLPRLKNLGLHICYRGNEMECSAGGFPELTYLTIDGLFWLHEWKVGPGALAKLESMEIYDSPIRVLPDTLPSCAKIVCNPCVKGIEKYNSCHYYRGQFE
ncbi:hypothetical protein Nepgr_024576 [Nepenthes gracilis]|uniref:Uncharacterized protein n=1 Tax=Nepenthes gracilis TaxID=150966 RepID=A0AAD3T4F1_NEPGR|nr:hypothetical protein Nepgr_024576 [Nepenthes gracilis]